MDKEDRSLDNGFPIGMYRRQLASLPMEARTMTAPPRHTKVHVRNVGGTVVRGQGASDGETARESGVVARDEAEPWETPDRSRMLASCLTLKKAYSFVSHPTFTAVCIVSYVASLSLGIVTSQLQAQFHVAQRRVLSGIYGLVLLIFFSIAFLFRLKPSRWRDAGWELIGVGLALFIMLLFSIFQVRLPSLPFSWRL